MALKICIRCNKPHSEVGDYCRDCREYLRVTTGYKQCPTCGGKGQDDWGRTCPVCRGTGRLNY